MASKTTELQIRMQTKEALKFLQEEKLEEACEVIRKHKEILRYNFGLINFVPLIPRIRFSKIIPKNNEALKMVIETGFELFHKEDNVNELLFFAAAKCDKEQLSACVKKILEENPENINQVREGDTALMFLIKYGNIADENCPECMKILVEAGIDVNRNDYFSHNPLIFLMHLYKRYVRRTQKDDVVIRNLKKCIELLLETRAIDLAALTIENTKLTAKDLLQELQFPGLNYSAIENSDKHKTDQYFKYLINNDEASFIKSKEVLELIDADDGNNTFLQLCTEKNLKVAAMFLIEKGADLIRTTERNQKTPLELAARRNHQEIFEALLKTNKISIDEELFLTFLRNRPKHIKAKYFDEILKYKQLDMNIKSNNGNTPLHYAIIFSSNEAIEALLQRGASLTVLNNSSKSPLDYISVEDLEKHFNKCIVPDNYNDLNSGKYELALNYRNLIETDNGTVQSELVIIEKICNSPKLCHLLNHPLISSFIDIKWKLVEPLYRKVFIFQLLFYLITVLSFINLPLLKYLALPLSFLYGVRIASLFNWKNNKLHEVFDISIAFVLLITIFISNNLVVYHLGVVITMFMAFSFHMFWRFSPNFSQFHAILINIIGHIFSYLSYVFILTLFFAAASYIFYLIRYENELDVDSHFNIFFTDVKMLLSHFYLLCAFGVFVSVIIIMTMINSLAFLQENAENVHNNFQISGHKNTLIFLKRVEEFYRKRRVIRNPFIFDETYLKDEVETKKELEGSKKKKQRKKNKFLINFCLNINKFSFEKLLAVKLTDVNVRKIRKALNH